MVPVTIEASIYILFICLELFDLFGIIIDKLLGSDENLLSSLSLVWSVLSSKARTFFMGRLQSPRRDVCFSDSKK